MARHTQQTPEEYEIDALLVMKHTFKCACCKKYTNRNKRKTVIGMFTWKKMPVCRNCFAVLGLEVTQKVGA